MNFGWPVESSLSESPLGSFDAGTFKSFSASLGKLQSQPSRSSDSQCLIVIRPKDSRV